jgi:nucleoside-diphosphate-sugar epimerase
MFILLTGGGTGFVGRHLKKALQENGFKVTLISRRMDLTYITWYLQQLHVPNKF